MIYRISGVEYLQTGLLDVLVVEEKLTNTYYSLVFYQMGIYEALGSTKFTQHSSPYITSIIDNSELE